MPNAIGVEQSRDILQTLREDRRRRIWHWLLEKACMLAMVVGLLNFAFFLAGAFYLGGDAWNGRIQDGKYYVWGYNHRHRTKDYSEVSKLAFEYSKWHVYTVIVTWPAAILAGFIYRRIPSED